jgi:single-strand DNA-binding protein
MNVNVTILGGNLTRDPDLNYAQSGTAVCNFTIAINNKRGEKEETCFASCVAFGVTAENITKYFGKGSPILVEGRLVTNSWTAEDGSKRSKLEVIVNRFNFVGKPSTPANATVEEDDEF